MLYIDNKCIKEAQLMDYEATIQSLEDTAYALYRRVNLETREVDFRQEELDGMRSILAAQNAMSAAVLRAYYLEKEAAV
jgi:hypothetical protein